MYILMKKIIKTFAVSQIRETSLSWTNNGGIAEICYRVNDWE